MSEYYAVVRDGTEGLEGWLSLEKAHELARDCADTLNRVHRVYKITEVAYHSPRKVLRVSSKEA